MPISRAELGHLCRLSHLELSESEMAAMCEEMSSVLDHVSLIQGVDTEGVEGTASAVPLDTVLRDDTPRESWPAEAVLANAPRRHDGFFEVPAVFD